MRLAAAVRFRTSELTLSVSISVSNQCRSAHRSRSGVGSHHTPPELPSSVTLQAFWRHACPPSTPVSCRSDSRPSSWPKLEASPRPSQQPVDWPATQAQQQHATSWPVEKIHHTWSFGSDATVLNDSALTTNQCRVTSALRYRCQIVRTFRSWPTVQWQEGAIAHYKFYPVGKFSAKKHQHEGNLHPEFAKPSRTEQSCIWIHFEVQYCLLLLCLYRQMYCIRKYVSSYFSIREMLDFKVKVFVLFDTRY